LQIAVHSISTSTDDDFEEIAGYSEILIQMGLAQGKEMKDLVNMTAEEYERLIAPFKSLYDQLSSSKRQEFTSLY
jgi:hypothetical protein